MAKVYIGGAGGAPSNNFIRSLKESNRDDYLVGASCVPSDLFLADVHEKHVVPSALDKRYSEVVVELLAKVRPDLIHMQNDYEVRAVSRLRKKVSQLGIKTYLPSEETVENCVDKSKSYAIWQSSGIRVPKTYMIRDENDLKSAFDALNGKIWIRAIDGGGGRGALPTDDYDFAKNWIDIFNGWGGFTASQLLTDKTVTWLSLWYKGELVVAQSRRRRSWSFGNRTLSGVTGITGVGETCSDTIVDTVALDAINSIDIKPHGIFAVDMTYDENNWPNPTEINIGRFFTTHYFFTRAGLNLPEIYCNIALNDEFPALVKKINPLPDGLIWIRGMDVEPVLTNSEELEGLEMQLLFKG